MKTQGNQHGTHAFRVHAANAPRLRVPKNLRGNPNNMFLARMIASSHRAQKSNFEKLSRFIETQIKRI